MAQESLIWEDEEEKSTKKPEISMKAVVPVEMKKELAE